MLIVAFEEGCRTISGELESELPMTDYIPASIWDRRSGI